MEIFFLSSKEREKERMNVTHVHETLEGDVASAVLLDTGEQVERVIDREVLKGGHLGFLTHIGDDLFRFTDSVVMPWCFEVLA